MSLSIGELTLYLNIQVLHFSSNGAQLLSSQSKQYRSTINQVSSEFHFSVFTRIEGLKLIKNNVRLWITRSTLIEHF